MRAVLTLQIPTDDWKRGRILAASSNSTLIRQFCEFVLEQRREEVDRSNGDVFSREVALVELEQLRARLSFALREEAS